MNKRELNILFEGPAAADNLEHITQKFLVKVYQASCTDFWKTAQQLNHSALILVSKQAQVSAYDWFLFFHQLELEQNLSAVKMVEQTDFKAYPKLFWPCSGGHKLKEISFENSKLYADALVRCGLDYFPPATLSNKDFRSWDELASLNLRPLFLASTTKKNKEHRSLQRALFLDRDGVIIKDAGYNIDPQKIELIPETLELMKKASSMGYLLIVLTNQSGVARDYFSEGDVESFHQTLHQQLSESQVHVDLWLSSFYHFEKGQGKFKKHSLTRKPGPGLALQALDEWPIDFSSSLMMGDKVSDDLDIPSLKTLHLKGEYDLTKAKETLIHSPLEALSFL